MFDYMTRIDVECLKYISAYLLMFLFIYHQFIPPIFPSKLFKTVTPFDFFFPIGGTFTAKSSVAGNSYFLF